MAKTFGLTRPDVVRYKKNVLQFINKGGRTPARFMPLESRKTEKRAFLQSVRNEYNTMLRDQRMQSVKTSKKLKNIYRLPIPVNTMRIILEMANTSEMENRFKNWETQYKKIVVD